MTLFCDFDGPIVDVSDRYYATYRLALTQTQAHLESGSGSLYSQGLHAMTKSQFWQMKQERIPDAEIALRSGLQGAAMDYFLEAVRRQVNLPELLQKDRLQPGVMWALALLKKQGFRLVLVTLRHNRQVDAILRHHDLISLFEGIYGVETEDSAYLNYADGKTHLLRQALGHHGGHGEMLPGWMIGDTEADVIAAHTLGIPAIALTCGIRSRSYLAKLKPSTIHSNLLLLAQSIIHS